MPQSRAVTCEGQGYRLRPLCERDAATLSDFYQDEQYWRYLPEGPRTLEQVQAFLADAVSQTNDPNGRETWWAVDDPMTETLIGTANIKRIGALADHLGSAGCTLSPDVQGQGLGTRLGWDLIGLAFDHFKFHRLELTCAVDNEGSVHIMRDVYGLTYEGLRRNRDHPSQGKRSSHVFSISAEGYSAQRGSKFLDR